MRLFGTFGRTECGAPGAALLLIPQFGRTECGAPGAALLLIPQFGRTECGAPGIALRAAVGSSDFREANNSERRTPCCPSVHSAAQSAALRVRPFGTFGRTECGAPGAALLLIPQFGRTKCGAPGIALRAAVGSSDFREANNSERRTPCGTSDDHRPTINHFLLRSTHELPANRRWRLRRHLAEDDLEIPAPLGGAGRRQT
ncbi:hypothetical protein LBMAG53_23770 [Planctomycetota bacterium]|nr:hypothetical protein LBMAG53_23770 [Planctomycetota bacterium]